MKRNIHSNPSKHRMVVNPNYVQVLNLEAELGLIQAHLAALHPPRPPASPPQSAQQAPLVSSSCDGGGARANGCRPSESSCLSTVFDPLHLHPLNDAESRCSQPVQQVEIDEVEALARDYFAKYMQGGN